MGQPVVEMTGFPRFHKKFGYQKSKPANVEVLEHAAEIKTAIAFVVVAVLLGGNASITAVFLIKKLMHASHSLIPEDGDMVCPCGVRHINLFCAGELVEPRLGGHQDML